MAVNLPWGYDAFNGMLLLDNGHGGSSAQPIFEKWDLYTGEGKAIVQLAGTRNSYQFAAS